MVGRLVRSGQKVVAFDVSQAALSKAEALGCETAASAEAAVAGVAHPVLGEDVAAWVVVRDDIVPDELRAFLLDRLADYKVPRRITVVDALPRNDSGKVVKSRLESGADPE